MLVVLSSPAACSSPPDVIDLSLAPQTTRDEMLHVQILPLGVPAPPGVGSVAPIEGYGCAVNASLAAIDAVQQLRVKALRLQATAVRDVLIAQDGKCATGYAATATGTALAARGVPPTW